MNAVDGSEHYERSSQEPSPSLLTVVLDVNLSVWASIENTLPLSKAIANILVFINAHLAYNYANKVAVIASHPHKAQFLYPAASGASHEHTGNNNSTGQNGEDVEMTNGGMEANGSANANGQSASGSHANKYRPFKNVENEVMHNLQRLISDTEASNLDAEDGTAIAGALSLALTYINKQMLLQNDATGSTIAKSVAETSEATRGETDSNSARMNSRILVVSVSDDQAQQYIPIMNCIFAAQRKRIPIDVLKLASETAFLQQAADATRGIYMRLSAPQGLLQYLMMGFLSDQNARLHMILPTQVNVDFRAACFCHKRVVEIGFVCSICLSIFCEPPPGAVCLTCGTHLQLGDYGSKPAVVLRKKKKKKRARDGTGTPTPAPE